MIIDKWLINGNQKRPFPDLHSFYDGEGYQWRDLKTRTKDIINSIPDGED